MKLVHLILGCCLVLVIVACVPPASTPTPTPSSPSTSYSFEGDIQGWGEHPENKILVPGKGVSAYCDKQQPFSHGGDCSIQFNPTEITNQNAYVAIRGNAQNSIITAYVLVPKDAEVCSSQGCSTVKIIVWDKNQQSHESEDYVELNQGTWVPISLDTSQQEWPGPWREFGFHFYLQGYKGPIYIDDVTVKSK